VSGALENFQGFIEILGRNVQVLSLQALGDALRTALHRQHGRARHGRSQGLRAAHAA
jgi:hypothetical protein